MNGEKRTLCKEGEQILKWLPQKEHRVDASSSFECEWDS